VQAKRTYTETLSLRQSFLTAMQQSSTMATFVIKVTRCYFVSVVKPETLGKTYVILEVI
jgi:hypothetical protein